jgi:hypothetical protein
MSATGSVIVAQARSSPSASAMYRGAAREAAKMVRDLGMEIDLERERGVDKHHREIRLI